MRVSILELSEKAYLELEEIFGSIIFSSVTETSDGGFDVILNEKCSFLKITNKLYIELGSRSAPINPDEFFMIEVR